MSRNGSTERPPGRRLRGPRLAPTGAGGPLEMIDSCGGDQSPAGGGAACRYASILRPAPPRRSAYGLHQGQPPGNFPLNRRLEVGAALGVGHNPDQQGLSSTPVRPTESTGALRDRVHAVIAAHDRQVNTQRDLDVRVAQPCRHHIQRDLPDHQPMPSGTVP